VSNPPPRDDKEPADKTTEKPESAAEQISPTGIPAEVLSKMPPKQRQLMESFFASMSIGPMPNPLAQKVTSEHIGQFIQTQADETKLRHDDRKDSRRFIFYGFLAASVFSSVLILTLAITNHGDILVELAKAGVLLTGGFGGGYGFSEWRRSRERD
jgi:hypothetical protein